MFGSAVFGLLSFGAVLEALVILGLAMLAYAAQSFLLVVQETAAGNDAVVWPLADTWHDRLGSVVALVRVIAVWLVVAYFVLALLDLPAAMFGLLAYAILWLFFPVSLLSLLSAASPWLILRPTIVWRLAKRLRSLLVFYAVTGLLLTLCLGVFGAAIFLGKLNLPPVEVDEESERLGQVLEVVVWLGQLFLLPVAACCLAAGLLLYARLLGRLGWLLKEDELAEQRQAARQRRAQGPVPQEHASAQQPAQLIALSIDGFELVEEAATPSAAASGAGCLGSTAEPLPFAVLPPEPNALLRDAMALSLPHLARLEVQLSAPSTPARPPKWPLVSGVYSFPLYRTTWGALFWLSVGNLFVIGILWIMVAVLSL